MFKSKMKAWTVTRVIVWLLCEYGSKQAKIKFCRTFYPFMQHHDADAVHRRTLRSPMSHFLNRRVGMGFQALNFRSRANYAFKISRIHACLQTVQHIQSPSPVENLPGLGQQCSLTRTTHHIFQVYKNNISKYMNFKLSAMQFLDIWKRIKRNQKATRNIRYPQKVEIFYCCIFFFTINMCDRGRTNTHLQIRRFHTQAWDDIRIIQGNFTDKGKLIRLHQCQDRHP